MDSGHQLPARRPKGIRRRTPGSLNSPDRVEVGSVGGPPNGGGEDSPPWIFLSYCHDDADWKEEFSSQLAVAESQGLVKVFSDGCIEDGATWEFDLQEAISKASVAILLLTPRFLTSEYSIQKEMNPLLERLARGEDVRIIPILVEPCLWKLVPGLPQLQIVTFSKGQEVRKGRALSELPPNEIQAQVAQQAWKILKDLGVIPPDDPDRPGSALAVPSVSNTTTAQMILVGSNVIDAKRRFRALLIGIDAYSAVGAVSLEPFARGVKHSDLEWYLLSRGTPRNANVFDDVWSFQEYVLTLVGISSRPYLIWDYEWGFIAFDSAGERSGQRSEVLPSVFRETLPVFRSLADAGYAPLHPNGTANRELLGVTLPVYNWRDLMSPDRFNGGTPPMAVDAWIPDGDLVIYTSGGTGAEHVWRVCADWYQNVIGHIAGARTFTNLLRAFPETPQVLHFMGHGQTLQAPAANLRLGDGAPPVEEWTEAWLGDELDDGTSVPAEPRVLLLAACASGATTTSPASARAAQWTFDIDVSRSLSVCDPERHPAVVRELAEAVLPVLERAGLLANSGIAFRFSLHRIFSGIDLRSSLIELVHEARRNGRSILENPEEDRLIKQIVLDESGWPSGTVAVTAPAASELVDQSLLAVDQPLDSPLGSADLSTWDDLARGLFSEETTRCPWNGLELWREPIHPKGGTPAVS